MIQRKPVTKNVFSWALALLAGLAYMAAVLGIALGGLVLVNWMLFREEKASPPAQAELAGGGGPLRIPNPAGMDGRQRLTPPPISPCAWEAWEEARIEGERWHPYDAELFLPDENPALAIAAEYNAPYGVSFPDGRENATCRLLVFAEPGGDAATWHDFRAARRALEEVLAAAARTGNGRKVFANGDRSWGYDAAPDQLADSARFVWVAGCRFVLRCTEDDAGSHAPLARAALPAILDGWIETICASVGVAPGAPDADEIACGNAWAAARRAVGKASLRALDAAEESGLADLRRVLRHVWSWIWRIAFVTGVGCLSVAVVWGLALAAALALFGKSRPPREFPVQQGKRKI